MRRHLYSNYNYGITKEGSLIQGTEQDMTRLIYLIEKKNTLIGEDNLIELEFKNSK